MAGPEKMETLQDLFDLLCEKPEAATICAAKGSRCIFHAIGKLAGWKGTYLNRFICNGIIFICRDSMVALIDSLKGKPKQVRLQIILMEEGEEGKDVCA